MLIHSANHNQGDHHTGKPGQVRELYLRLGKVRKIGKKVKKKSGKRHMSQGKVLHAKS